MKFIVGIFLLILNIPLATSQQERANILFILTDDQRWDALGFSGNSFIHTPEMDRLAASGFYFENAFVTSPICAASRASILTGLYERTHQYTFQAGDIRQEYVDISYPAILRKEGYYLGFFGKFGINYPGFDKLFDSSENFDRNGNFADYRGYFYKTIGRDTVHLSRYTGQKAIDFIANAPADKPFMLSLSFSAPHAHDPSEMQYFWSPEFDTMYQNLVIPDPDMSDAHYFNLLPDYVRKGENRTRWYWRFDSYEKYQRSVKAYYRMVSEIDAEIGKIREVLAEKNLDKNTIIIVMGDNGYFLGERQLAGKWLLYDNSIRVPLILFDPRSPGGIRKKDLALNIDIPATILDLAGIEIPKNYQGTSLVSEQLAERKDFLIEHLWRVDIIPASEGIRTKRWKYFHYLNESTKEELYDLETDPLERKNLANNPETQNQLMELRNRMKFLIGQKISTRQNNN